MIRHFVYDTLRRITPGRMRRWIKAQPWFYPFSKLVFNNVVYSKSYYEDVERIENESSKHIAEWIHKHLRPRRVLDVGCGPGHIMAALKNRGIDVFGVDVSPQSRSKVTEKGLPWSCHDLTDSNTSLAGSPYDLVVSCEVAEHLEARYAPLFVKKLTDAGKALYMTAARPDAAGPGLYHVNEQPEEYWIQLMVKHGYELDVCATENARKTLGEAPVVSYLAEPMIFRRSERLAIS